MTQSKLQREFVSGVRGIAMPLDVPIRSWGWFMRHVAGGESYARIAATANPPRSPSYVREHCNLVAAAIRKGRMM